MRDKIAVIGAGMAGLAAARRLKAAGLEPVLFDKGRSVGGRLSTRRVESARGEARFDHGAQYVTAREPGFRAALGALAARSAAASWDARFADIGYGPLRIASPETRYVGAPGMSALARAIGEELDVRVGVRVERLVRVREGWLLEMSGESVGPVSAVAVAVPAEQVAALIAEAAPALAQEAQAARTAPCWAAMAVFERPVPVEFDAARITRAGPLAWVAREGSKPLRPQLEAWTLHATPDWSRAHLEAPAEEVARALVQAFAEIGGAGATALESAHRWRYALVERPAATPFTWDADLRLGVCGDWRIGPRVEAAFQSGDGLGAAMAVTLAPPGAY